MQQCPDVRMLPSCQPSYSEACGKLLTPPTCAHPRTAHGHWAVLLRVLAALRQLPSHRGRLLVPRLLLPACAPELVGGNSLSSPTIQVLVQH